MPLRRATITWCRLLHRRLSYATRDLNFPSKIVSYTSDSGFSFIVSCVPAMPDFTFRELAIAAAIVIALSSQFLDRQILQAALEALKVFW